MAIKRELIRKKAIELLNKSPNGIHYSELHKKLQKYFPDTPYHTIRAYTWNLHIVESDHIYKPELGLFKYKSE